MKQDDYKSFNAEHFVFEVPLYRSWRYAISYQRPIEAMFTTEDVRVRGFCPSCCSVSMFHSAVYHDRFARALMHDHSWNLLGVKLLGFVCQLNSSHVIHITTQGSVVEDEDISRGPVAIEMTKVGQHPSHADIANGDVSRYAKVMSSTDRAEFIRANGLAANGVYIGSFVYLRRLFERLIKRAEDRSTDIDRQTMNKKVPERISDLSDVLPSFMVENKTVYKFLSKGVHELSEENCGQMYEILKESVLLMLQQEKEIAEKRLREDKLQKAISGINAVSQQ